ncbi:hypothetical protein K3725_08315 [Leisingera sp. S132]|uniref:hypothetical protein n=1 Tax=Leisingera sp. S132 TaxID=2867016 RepID=UPI0021A6C89C|nr:hypothetical protein [Leisingera sp. S132]UWQ80985.1 hypothetical protein K3725_08315 [Leisingera sp. S132]
MMQQLPGQLKRTVQGNPHAEPEQRSVAPAARVFGLKAANSYKAGGGPKAVSGMQAQLVGFIRLQNPCERPGLPGCHTAPQDQPFRSITIPESK